MPTHETHTPQSDEPELPDTEVIIPVPPPAPVFVDSTGRRRRLLRRASYGFAAFCVVYGGLVSVSLAGGPARPNSMEPFRELADGATPAPTVPAPGEPAPSSSPGDPTPTPAASAGVAFGPPARLRPAPVTAAGRPPSPADPGNRPVLESTRAPAGPATPSPRTPSPLPTPTTAAPTPGSAPSSPASGGTGGTGGGAQAGTGSAPTTGSPTTPPAGTPDTGRIATSTPDGNRSVNGTPGAGSGKPGGAKAVVDQARPGRTATDKKGADKKGADKKGSDRKGAVPCPSVTIALTVVGLLTSRESAP